MNVSSLSQPMQQLTAQQVSAAAAVSDDSIADFEPEAAGTSPTGSAGTSLSGSTTASLSDQTLQALLGLTQNDPADQAQGAQHHHHHHHGAGQKASAQDALPNTSSDPTANLGEADSSTAAGSDDSDSLATALGA